MNRMRELLRRGALSYLPTSRRDTREIRPRHSLSQEHSTALHHTQSTLLEQHLSAAGRSVSILLYIPRSFRLPPPFILVHLSVSPSLSFFPSRSTSIYLPACLSLSLSPSPFVTPVGEILRRRLPFPPTLSPCSRRRRPSRVNERDAAIGDDRQRRRG